MKLQMMSNVMKEIHHKAQKLQEKIVILRGRLEALPIVQASIHSDVIHEKEKALYDIKESSDTLKNSIKMLLSVREILSEIEVEYEITSDLKEKAAQCFMQSNIAQQHADILKLSKSISDIFGLLVSSWVDVARGYEQTHSIKKMREESQQAAKQLDESIICPLKAREHIDLALSNRRKKLTESRSSLIPEQEKLQVVPVEGETMVPSDTDEIYRLMAMIQLPKTKIGYVGRDVDSIIRDLRKGLLDDKEIEVDVVASPIGVEITAPPGMEEMNRQLIAMFQSPKQEARTILTPQQASIRWNPVLPKLQPAGTYSKLTEQLIEKTRSTTSTSEAENVIYVEKSTKLTDRLAKMWQNAPVSQCKFSDYKTLLVNAEQKRNEEPEQHDFSGFKPGFLIGKRF